MACRGVCGLPGDLSGFGMISDRAAGGGQTAVFLIATATALLALGVVMVLSAAASLEHPSGPHAWAGRSWGELWQDAAFRQLAFAFGGFVAMLVASVVPYRWWCLGRRSSWQVAAAVMIVTLACLVAVLIPGVGVERRGARRWLAIGAGLAFQPSEMAKLVLVLFMAAWFGRPGTDPKRFLRGLGPVLLAAGLCVGLVGIEDFGTALLLALVAGAILLVAGARLRHLLVLAVAGAGSMAALLFAQPYRIERLRHFFDDVWADPAGKGYQAVQSLCAIGAGGWFGKGLGAGMQKYGYLPESRTDFIFAIICEELGVVGGLAVLALFCVLLWNGQRAMARAQDAFGRLVAFGITMTIGLQAAMNVAVVTVSIPTKGIALPLVSSGGSGLLFVGAAVGILASVARYGPQVVLAPAAPGPPGRARQP